jgi:hypothetical protein
MKRKILFLVTILTTVIFINPALYGQTEEEIPKIRFFGVGMHIEQFNTVDIWMVGITTVPVNKVVFTISPIRNFRLEPEIGYSSFDDRSTDLTYKNLSLGIGGFAMYQLGKTNVYGGLRFEDTYMSDEYVQSSSGSSVVTGTEKTTRLEIGPAFGAEYFFGKHFSFGGEIGLRKINIRTKGDQSYGGGIHKKNYFTSNMGVLLRFYF